MSEISEIFHEEPPIERGRHGEVGIPSTYYDEDPERAVVKHGDFPILDKPIASGVIGDMRGMLVHNIGDLIPIDHSIVGDDSYGGEAWQAGNPGNKNHHKPSIGNLNHGNGRKVDTGNGSDIDKKLEDICRAKNKLLKGGQLFHLRGAERKRYEKYIYEEGMLQFRKRQEEKGLKRRR
ncbi:hypothetical protein HYV56_00850 [Candidatus Peregrinibacteria bacterium]|nr:hypothetical protein [Candidatus Peregrinibacteria bacterium]